MRNQLLVYYCHNDLGTHFDWSHAGDATFLFKNNTGSSANACYKDMVFLLKMCIWLAEHNQVSDCWDWEIHCMTAFSFLNPRHILFFLEKALITLIILVFLTIVIHQKTQVIY